MLKIVNPNSIFIIMIFFNQNNAFYIYTYNKVINEYKYISNYYHKILNHNNYRWYLTKIEIIMISLIKLKQLSIKY